MQNGWQGALGLGGKLVAGAVLGPLGSNLAGRAASSMINHTGWRGMLPSFLRGRWHPGEANGITPIAANGPTDWHGGGNPGSMGNFGNNFGNFGSQFGGLPQHGGMTDPFGGMFNGSSNVFSPNYNPNLHSPQAPQGP